MSRQAGGALPLVLSLLALVSLLVLSSSRQLESVGRQADNAEDRQRAETQARQALLGAEQWVWRLDRRLALAAADPDKLYGEGRLFPPSCDGAEGKGLCEPREPPHRRRVNDQDLLHPCGNSREYALSPGGPQTGCPQRVRGGAFGWWNPRYVVELIDPRFGDAARDRLYRITVRAWGRQPQNAVTLQSWYRVGEEADEGRRLDWREVEE
ncbi:pilus assembly protein [Chromobacterium phragmitis]|uniref:Pilus assembly protein n=1 Tax=Chromobacterium phragmitis TaxID=2202141 RepID=A0ABV0IXF1_9NEIS|nr:pilus assembly protein [Chromobacterium phragmitis]